MHNSKGACDYIIKIFGSLNITNVKQKNICGYIYVKKTLKIFPSLKSQNQQSISNWECIEWIRRISNTMWHLDHLIKVN